MLCDRYRPLQVGEGCSSRNLEIVLRNPVCTCLYRSKELIKELAWERQVVTTTSITRTLNILTLMCLVLC